MWHGSLVKYDFYACRKPKQMTDFFKPVALKQSLANGKTEDGTRQTKPSAAVLQSMANGQPRFPAATQKPKAPMARAQTAKSRHPFIVNSIQPDAKRQRTLGVTATSQQGYLGPRSRQQAQPSAHGASVIDISMSDVSAAACGPPIAQDMAATAEDVSSQQMMQQRQHTSSKAAEQGHSGIVGEGACTKQPDAHLPASPLGSCAAKDEAPTNGSHPEEANASTVDTASDLSTLEALGFSRSRAQAALSRCRNDVGRAANLLFSGVT